MRANKYLKVVVIILITLFVFSQNSYSKTTFTEDKLRNMIYNFISYQVGEDAEVNLPKIINPQAFNEDNVTANIVTNIDNLIGNITIKFEFKKNGTLLRYYEIPARIKFYKNVVVATQPIIAGEYLDERSLTIEKKEITNLKEEQFFSKNSLKGMRAKRNIPKGTIVTKFFVDNGNLVKRGDKVSLVVKSGGVSIKTYGVALQDGVIGENLRVKREGFQGVFQGKLNNNGIVEIVIN